MPSDTPCMSWAKTSGMGIQRGAGSFLKEVMVNPEKVDRGMTAIWLSAEMDKTVRKRLVTICERGLDSTTWVIVSGTNKFYEVAEIMPDGYIRLVGCSGRITPCNCLAISLWPQEKVI